MKTLILYLLTITFSNQIQVMPVKEIPTFDLNFYMMGMTEMDEEVPVRISNNIEYLNEEFEGFVKFRLGRLFMDSNHAYIPDLHTEHLKYRHENIKELVDPIEVQGSISVFLFDTYSKDDGNTAMLGFTPVLTAQHKEYEKISPRFDRLFISYAGLIDMSTIVHEMGHFLGLSHPWEMKKIDIEMMGLHGAQKERNHMTYHPQVDHFTIQQLERMQHFALTFRKYLISKIEINYPEPIWTYASSSNDE